MNFPDFLKKAEEIGDNRIFFHYPDLELYQIQSEFAGLSEEERESWFAGHMDITIGELRKMQHHLLITPYYLTKEEFENKYSQTSNHGSHWLNALLSKRSDLPKPSIKTVHFYGYKGGQARSTLLAMLAQSLAEDGWRVLIVDADIEAPSLDILFNSGTPHIRNSLIGIVRGEPIQPLRVDNPAKSGYVDLIPCRPMGEIHDTDTAAFALHTVLDPFLIEKAAREIEAKAGQEYDLVLIDHRAGISPYNIPWMRSLPGAMVVCTRLDEQWRASKGYIRALMRNVSDINNFVFVSWNNHDESVQSYFQRTGKQQKELLDLFAETLSEGEEDEFDIDDMRNHWLIWPYDPAFRDKLLPELKNLSGEGRGTIGLMRGLLELRGEKERILSASGARDEDEDDFIRTEAYNKLSAPNNPYTYIFGRKGTGKTRLMRVLADEGLGEPLLVDPGYVLEKKRGIQGSSELSEIGRATELFKDDPGLFWWQLLAAALETPKDIATDSELIERFRQKISNPDSRETVTKNARESVPRTFLIDGLETTFRHQYMISYLEVLFRFLQVMETDDRLNHIRFRLFLRSDMAEHGYQNLEQQIDKRVIYLSWNTQSIFNFALLRILQNNWYEENFPEATQEINKVKEKLQRGALSRENCEALFLKIFPERLPRFKMGTITFLTNYFADTAREDAVAQQHYYPRVYDNFLRIIANSKQEGYEGKDIEADESKTSKISPALIFYAHQKTTEEYRSQLQSELDYLLHFDESMEENRNSVDRLLSAFKGRSSPFQREAEIKFLANKIGHPQEKIRESLDRMKRIGIFEDHPDRDDRLRAGRLFRSALKMKYARKKRE